MTGPGNCRLPDGGWSRGGMTSEGWIVSKRNSERFGWKNVTSLDFMGYDCRFVKCQLVENCHL